MFAFFRFLILFLTCGCGWFILIATSHHLSVWPSVDFWVGSNLCMNTGGYVLWWIQLSGGYTPRCEISGTWGIYVLNDIKILSRNFPKGLYSGHSPRQDLRGPAPPLPSHAWYSLCHFHFNPSGGLTWYYAVAWICISWLTRTGERLPCWPFGCSVLCNSRSEFYFCPCLLFDCLLFS